MNLCFHSVYKYHISCLTIHLHFNKTYFKIYIFLSTDTTLSCLIVFFHLFCLLFLVVLTATKDMNVKMLKQKISLFHKKNQMYSLTQLKQKQVFFLLARKYIVKQIKMSNNVDKKQNIICFIV